ncbi:uncharacterized protein LOC112186348 isoform X3 [Rosa chinensis]|uniref:uncharacterized protein LOC112186348 isoform X3 n=1 Tax=Rosa chinensis TaxID=74649 RepID=UPI001AD8CE1A|nr:uncharacterized protein LOC112186348 isoform X3 [Rosa chinensis]
MVNQAPTSSDMEEKPSSKRVKSEDDHVAKEVKTEEDHYGSKSLDTAKADKLVWLMKLPQTVAKSWNSHPSSDPHPFAKVALSLDPLETDKTSSVQDGNTNGVNGNNVDWDTEDELDEIENFTLSSSSANLGPGEVRKTPIQFWKASSYMTTSMIRVIPFDQIVKLVQQYS